MKFMHNGLIIIEIYIADVRFTHNMKDAYYVKFNASKAKELIIFKNVYQYNVSLTDELLQECGIDPSTFLFYGTDK